MNSPFINNLSSKHSNCIAICKLQTIDKEIKVANELESLEFEYGIQKLQQEDLDLQYITSMDLEQMCLGNQDFNHLERFSIRNNYAIALTKKKEPLYWGTIEEDKNMDEKQCFTDRIMEIEQGKENKDEMKQYLLPKRISCKNCNVCQQCLVFKNIKITDICCNDFAVHFLSEDGMLYTMGKDPKKYGILGLGSQYEMATPSPNTNLIDFRIKQISMGLSHCVALTHGGQLYSWGTGQNGQLCLFQDDTMSTNLPKCIPGSKNMNVTSVHCSSYYTLLVNQDNQISMYGTLKGFAKFLFDSPTKESKYKDESESHCQKLTFNNEKINKISLSEKCFAVSADDHQKLYIVTESLQPQLILNRRLKSFQFLNSTKYLIAHDTNNMLVILQQKRKDISQSDEAEWQIVKEINLIKEFNTNDIEMIAQDSTTKRMQSMQLLTFVTQNKPLKQLVNMKKVKTFLNKESSNQQLDVNASKNGLSPYVSYQDRPSRKKLQIKLDTLFGTNKKDQDRSKSIKERAKKLHQSLSPVQRFPLINNLCEFIKKQQNIQDLKSPDQSNSRMDFVQGELQKSSQLNILLNSFNFACQLNNLGEPMNNKSGKQAQFLQKAEKLREELGKKNSKYDIRMCSTTQGGNDMIELASPNMSRSTIQQINNNVSIQQQNIVCKADSYSLPLQMPTLIHKQIIHQKNLSCIIEDREQNNYTCMNNPHDKDLPSTRKDHNQDKGSLMRVPYHKKNRMSEVQAQRNQFNQQDMINMDTFSEISERDSNYRFSLGSCLTNSNSYRILLMNVRNVIEKKTLFHLMMGFSSIKYSQQQNPSIIQNSCISNQTVMNQRNQEQGAANFVKLMNKFTLDIKRNALNYIYEKSTLDKNQKRALKKIGNLLQQKQDQLILDSLSKIKLVVKFSKLQKLNLNILFNTLNKFHKKQSKLLQRSVLQEILSYSIIKKQEQCILKIASLITDKMNIQGLSSFKNNMIRARQQKQGLKILKQTLQQIMYRAQVNKEHYALKCFKQNVLQYKEQRVQNLHQIILKLSKVNTFKRWLKSVQKRKIATQQAYFIKMMIQDQIKRQLYYSFSKICRIQKQSDSTQQSCSKTQECSQKQKEQSQTKLNTEQTSQVEVTIQRQESDLDIEESQMENDDCIQQHKINVVDLPRQLTGFCQEFSFDENEEIPHQQQQQLTLDNNITAHFSKNNNIMSRGKESVNKKLDLHEFKETYRPTYHCHYANEEEDTPDAFILDPLQGSQINVTINNDTFINDSSETQRIPLKMLIQNEISPSHNYKNFQRQNNICKNYEQSDPFEMPDEDIENQQNLNKITSHNIPMQLIKENLNKEVKDFLPRYSFKQVLPFNPPEDTPSDTQLRKRREHGQLENQKQSQLFLSKKQSVPVIAQDKKFINNYFNKLSSQAQSKQQSQNTSQNSSVREQLLQQQQSKCTSKLIPNQAQNQTSFVTNNGVDIMHFNSQSDNSFLFFDGNTFFLLNNLLQMEFILEKVASHHSREDQ